MEPSGPFGAPMWQRGASLSTFACSHAYQAIRRAAKKDETRARVRHALRIVMGE